MVLSGRGRTRLALALARRARLGLVIVSSGFRQRIPGSNFLCSLLRWRMSPWGTGIAVAVEECDSCRPEMAACACHLGDACACFESLVLSSIFFDRLSMPAHKRGRRLLVIIREIEVETEAGPDRLPDLVPTVVLVGAVIPSPPLHASCTPSADRAIGAATVVPL